MAETDQGIVPEITLRADRPEGEQIRHAGVPKSSGLGFLGRYRSNSGLDKPSMLKVCWYYGVVYSLETMNACCLWKCLLFLAHFFLVFLFQ